MNSGSSAFSLDVVGANRSWQKRQALVDVSLSLPAGQVVALVGPSGSGKTTLLNLLTGAVRPTAGVVTANGVDLATLNQRDLQQHRAHFGRVHQGAALVPQLSLHHNVVAGMLPKWPWYRVLASRVWRTDIEKVASLLAQVGLADRQFDRAVGLSGGEQQRILVARALISNSPIVLADEPTAALDPELAGQIAELLISSARDGGSTLVYCTHWLSLIRGRVDRVVGLREGRVFLDKPATDVRDEDLDALYSGSTERH